MNLNITPGEAMLIDWILTMHTYDMERLRVLKQSEMYEFRKEAGRVIAAEKELEVEFTKDEVDYLLIAIPITFRFAKEDVGYSLKSKLFKIIAPPPIELDWEIKPKEDEVKPTEEAIDESSGNANQGDSESSSEDSSRAAESSIPPGEDMS